MGPIVNYDGQKIANQIEDKYKTEKEKDIAIFTLYNSYGKAGDPACNEITNNTVKHLSNKEYKNLDEYLSKKGFTNLEDYENRMRDLISTEYKYNENLNISGGKQWK